MLFPEAYARYGGLVYETRTLRLTSSSAWRGARTAPCCGIRQDTARWLVVVAPPRICHTAFMRSAAPNPRTLCCFLYLLYLLYLPAAALADEIRLKDGSKITGTIVGFENDSFKVQTSYGFALVKKDKIAAIIPSATAAEAKPEPKKEAAKEAKKPEAAAAIQPALQPSTIPATQPASVAPAVRKETIAITTAAVPQPTANVEPPPPPKPPEPVIRDEVIGNLYINHTYGFHMFKPPRWEMIEGARKTMPTAVVAMGTGDETTLLVVGREPAKTTLEAHAAATERQLREIYENYRQISEQRMQVAGLAAIERRYRGMADGHDWSGLVITLIRDNDVYTVLGMTWADSDLIQIQENVIARTISSLEFTK